MRRLRSCLRAYTRAMRPSRPAHGEPRDSASPTTSCRPPKKISAMLSNLSDKDKTHTPPWRSAHASPGHQLSIRRVDKDLPLRGPGAEGLERMVPAAPYACRRAAPTEILRPPASPPPPANFSDQPLGLAWFVCEQPGRPAAHCLRAS